MEYPVHCLRQMGVAGFLPTQESLTATPVADQHPPGPDRPGQDHQDSSGPDHSPGSSSQPHTITPDLEPTATPRTAECSPEGEGHPPEKQSTPQPPARPKVVNVVEIVDKLLRENSREKILRFLENKTSLYLSDTGGQIEFQELLALLSTPRAVHLFLFSLVHGLDKKVQVSFREGSQKGCQAHQPLHFVTYGQGVFLADHVQH